MTESAPPRRAPDYGALGRVGVAVPQANPTVEPEMRLLLPAEIGVYATRLSHPSPDLDTRLRYYLAHLPEAIATFGSLALRAFGVGCTGSSYVAGLETEDRATAEASASAGIPVITAAQAIRHALREMGASAVALVSPYPPGLSEAGYSYWAAAGVTLTTTLRVDERLADSHAIYELTSDDALHALRAIDPRGADCVLCTGTGMPTIKALATLRRLNPLQPVLSANLCLAWALYRAVDRKHAPPTPVGMLRS